MPTAYKILGQANPASTAQAALITVGAGLQQVISTLNIANNTASAASAQVWVRIAGAAASAANIVIPTVPVAANTSLALTLGITLGATDVVTVQSSTASALTFTAFGSEIS
jgi:ribosomal protein L11